MLKKMTKYWNLTVESQKSKVESLQAEIEKLKEERKQKSSELQQRLFAEYAFLNQEQNVCFLHFLNYALEFVIHINRRNIFYIFFWI